MDNMGFYNIFNKSGEKIGSIEPNFTVGLINFLMAPLMPLLGVAAFVFTIWLSFTMVTFLLGALDSGGVLSYEICAMVIGTLISWGLAYLIVVLAKNDDDVLPACIGIAGAVIIVGTYIFSLIGIAYVDIVYNDAFANFFSGLWFIIAMILSLFTTLLWTFVTSIVGFIIVGLCAGVTKLLIICIKYQIKLNKKINKIKRSDYYTEVINAVNSFGEVNIQTIEVSEETITIENNEGKKNILNYVRDGYSSLDEDGRLSIAILLKREYKSLKVMSKSEVLVIANKDFIKKCREDEKKAKSAAKRMYKEEKINRKKQIKEAKKSTKDW